MTHHSVGLSLLSTTAVIETSSPMEKVFPDEVFANWRVVCVGQEGRKVHVARFQRNQVGAFSKVMIDLGLSEGGGMLGILILPHGLKPREGIRLQVDDGEVSSKLPFASVGPSGGVVRLNMAADTVIDLREAEKLKIYARTASTAKKLVFSLPLDGFAAAVDRLKEIKRSGIM